VISEVIYGYLRLALNVSKYRLKEYIIEHVDKVKELLEQDVYPLFTNFNHLPTSVGIDTLIEYMTKYKLLSNDALIAATCKAHGIGDIATFDENFKRVPGHSNFTKSSTIPNIGDIFNFNNVTSQPIGIAKGDKKEERINITIVSIDHIC